jgi:hypothetical protein
MLGVLLSPRFVWKGAEYLWNTSFNFHGLLYVYSLVVMKISHFIYPPEYLLPVVVLEQVDEQLGD